MSAQQPQTPNPLLVKFEVLKKALKDERKQKSELEAEVIKLKEEVVIKQENLDKMKKELLKLREKNGKNQLSFITNIFDNNNESAEPQKSNDDEEEKELLRKQIEDLKGKLSSFEEEQNIINHKLTESIKANNELKTKHEEEVNQLNKEHEDKMNEMVSQYEEKIKNLQKQIFEQNQTINEQTSSIKCMSELYKSFDVQKVNYEKEIETLKKDFAESKKKSEQKTAEVEILLKDQNNLLKAIENDKDEISQLKDEIRQYKSIIEDLTPLSVDHLFQGYIIPTEKGMTKKRVDLSFGKYKQSLYFKAEDEEEKVFVAKEIGDIVYDKRSNNKVWVCVFIKGKQKNYLCEFTRKEIEFIIRFYNGIIKGKPNTVENALMNVSLGGYYY